MPKCTRTIRHAALALLISACCGTAQHGSRLGAFPSFPNGAVTLTTDATLTGAGTVASPLGVNPAAALAPDWFGYMANFFSQKSGLSALAWGVLHSYDFANDGTDPLALWGTLGALTGHSAVQTSIAGGVIKLTGPSAGASEESWYGALGNSATIGNLRTKRWMMCARWSLGTAPFAAQGLSVGVYNGDYIGLGVVGVQTNLRYVRGASNFLPVDRANTGSLLVVDSTGATGYRTTCIGNFDLVHVQYVADMAVSNTLVNAELLTNLQSAGGFPVVYNATSSGGSPVVFLDKVWVAAEM